MNTFNALGYSEALTDAGVPENQARLQAKALLEAFESNDLATVSDIAELRADVKSNIVRLEAKITELKADVKAQISEMELRIIKWQIGGIGLVIAAIKFL